MQEFWGKRTVALIIDVIFITLFMWALTAILYPLIALTNLYFVFNFWFIPVSYTHLDVYKRQIMNNALELRKFVAPEFIFGSGARLLVGRYARALFMISLTIPDIFNLNNYI